MSPNVGNFVHDLVEMAKAMEMLPGVQAELADARSELQSKVDTVQRLELKLMDRAAEIDALHAKVREAEAGRDAAETMFLECDDKRLALARVVESFTGSVATLLKAQEPPPAPAPVEAPQAVQPEQASSNPQADAPPVTVDPSANEPPRHDMFPEPEYYQKASEVAPPAAPTAEPSAGQSGAGSPAAPNTGATSTGPEGVGANGPFVPSTAGHSAPSGSTGAETQAVLNSDAAAQPTPEPGPAIGDVSDPEPQKYMGYPDAHAVRAEWLDWYDRQTPEFRSNYRW